MGGQLARRGRIGSQLIEPQQLAGGVQAVAESRGSDLVQGSDLRQALVGNDGQNGLPGNFRIVQKIRAVARYEDLGARAPLSQSVEEDSRSRRVELELWFLDADERHLPGVTVGRLEERHQNSEGAKRSVRHVGREEAPGSPRIHVLPEHQNTFGTNRLGIDADEAGDDPREVFFNSFLRCRGVSAQLGQDAREIAPVPNQQFARIRRLEIADPVRVDAVEPILKKAS